MVIFQQTEYLECNCTCGDHMLRVKMDSGDDWPFIVVDIQLNQSNSLWQRIKNAIKYIFGYECKYGHWDEVLLDRKSVDKLKSIINSYEYAHCRIKVEGA